MQLCTSCSSSCHQHLRHSYLQYNPVLVPAKPDPSGKWPLKRREKPSLIACANYSRGLRLLNTEKLLTDACHVWWQVISCQLIFDIIKMLVERFAERDIELLHRIVKGENFNDTISHTSVTSQLQFLLWLCTHTHTLLHTLSHTHTHTLSHTYTDTILGTTINGVKSCS